MLVLVLAALPVLLSIAVPCVLDASAVLVPAAGDDATTGPAEALPFDFLAILNGWLLPYAAACCFSWCFIKARADECIADAFE